MSNPPSRRQMSEEYATKWRAARASSSMQGERRVITMLFCDVIGSTEMASQLDPEEWAEIMDEAFDYMIAPVYKYEGTVARLMGDAILAFFGAPVAHEDDPQRAVLAGLDIVIGIRPFRQQIKREYGFDFNVRVGINTGPVVVGEIGSDLALEYTAMGDAINLAARMEETAAPGTVQISEQTYRVVASLFDVWEAGDIEIKGRDEPVRAYRVLGRLAQPGRLRGIKGIDTPLVGRFPEMDRLRQVMAEVRQGSGRIVCLIGEAGLGKSRLIDELRDEWIAASDHPEAMEHWDYLEGVSYGASRPYGMLKHRLHQRGNIRDTDPPEVVRDRLAELLTLYPEPLRKRMQSIYAILLGAADGETDLRPEGEAFKRELLSVMLESLQVKIGSTPTVYVLDDLHWGDPASVETMRHLLQLTESHPVLFLGAMRPERDAPGWQLKVTAETLYPGRYTEIVLEPLTSDDSTELVNSLLAIADLPANLYQTILQKAEGNPFFIEEVVRSLMDSGAVVRDDSGLRWQAVATVDQISIPDNVLALLAARIDRLDREACRTLQLASVIGRSFYGRVLRHVADSAEALDDHLNKLEQMEMIREAGRVPEIEYIFRHALTRDAAYKSILHRRRRQFHQRVGEAFEQLFPERLEEEAHRLAYHFHEARDVERALKYYTMAGDAAARLYANTEAVEHYGRAVAIARSVAGDEQLIYLYAQRGRTLEQCGLYDDALANYGELITLASERSRPALELAGLVHQATIYATPTVRLDAARGRKLSEHALTLAQTLQDHRAEARVYWNLMLLHAHATRDLERALSFGERSVSIARRHKLREELAFALHDLSRTYMMLGRLEEAWTAQDEAHQLWRDLNNMPMLADSLGTMAQGMHMMGRFDAAIELAEEGLQISQSIGNPWGQAFNLYTLGTLYLERGQTTRGIQTLEESARLARLANFAGPPSAVPIVLAWIRAALGDTDYSTHTLEHLLAENEIPEEMSLALSIWQAQHHFLRGDVDRADEIIEELGDSLMTDAGLYFGVYMLKLSGEVALARRQFDRALGLVDKTIGKMQATGTRLFLPDLLHVRGQALLDLGQAEAGYTALTEAWREAASQMSRRCLWPILVTLSRVEAERGNTAVSQERLREAQTIVEYVSNHIDEPALRSSFLNLPEVRAISQG